MIPAVVLAAGKSTRMGRPKALLPVEGGTFLSRIVTTLDGAGVSEIVVVLGHQASAIRAAHEALRVRFAVNEAFDTGQLSSLLVGLDTVDRPGVEAALVTLVDVPLISRDTVAAVIERYRRTRALLVRPVDGSRHGHPVLIDRSLFGELRGADPAVGAKPVVRRYASVEGDVEVADPGAFTDIDTPAEYARMTGVNPGRR